MLLDEFQVKPNLYAPACSPCIVDDYIILNVGGKNAGIVGLDAATGQTVLSATNDSASYASPVAATIHGRTFVFLNTQEHFTSIEPASGRVFWQIPFQAKNHEMVTASSPVVHGDLVVASAYQVGAICVRVLPDGRHEELWREGPRTLSNQFNNMVCRDTFLYSFTALDRSLRCLNLANGELLWKCPSEFGRGAMSVAVNDHLILIGELGHLGLIQVGPESANVKYFSKSPILAKPCFTQPALHDGRLYLRNEKELVCFDLRKPS
jgi:outer membrane protein assembly factor BamB